MQAEDIIKVFPELKDKFVCKSMYVIKCEIRNTLGYVSRHTLWASFDIEALKYILKSMNFNNPVIFRINKDSTVVESEFEKMYITEEPLYVGIE